MEKDILMKLKMDSRDEVVSFLKSLWSETPKPCPSCNGKLDFLHKKAKKSNCDWNCNLYIYKNIKSESVEVYGEMVQC